MRVIYPSEKSVDFEQTTWCYIPEDSTLYVTSHLHDDNTEVMINGRSNNTAFMIMLVRVG
jgi:hypothetical protein